MEILPILVKILSINNQSKQYGRIFFSSIGKVIHINQSSDPMIYSNYIKTCELFIIISRKNLFKFLCFYVFGGIGKNFKM